MVLLPLEPGDETKSKGGKSTEVYTEVSVSMRRYPPFKGD